MAWDDRTGRIIRLSDRRADDGAAENAIWIDQDGWDEQTLPVRPWIAGGYLLKGSVTVLSGAGSAGKSMLALGYAIALGKGELWGRFAPVEPCRVSVYNVEDDKLEQRRRLSAALRQHDLTPAWTANRIARIGPTDVGTLLEFDSAGLLETPAMNALREHLSTFKPKVLIVDPLVELHSAEENDNTSLRTIIAKFRALAIEFEMAIVILHHSRKGIPTPGDPDTLRGASSIVGAARIVLTVCVMSTDEALELGISATSRWRFFRVDGAKSNYAPPREAEWYERVDYTLDNGEIVAAAVPWQPKLVTASPELLMQAELLVGKGSAYGPWSPKLGKDARSFANALRQLGVSDHKGQQTMLDQLFVHGVVVASFRRDRHSAREAPQGLRTAAGEPSSVAWVD